MITWDRKGGLKLILTLSKPSVEFPWQVKRLVSLSFGGAIINNNNNNWNLYSAFSIHKMFKSAAHCHSLSNSPQRLNGRA